MIALLPLDNRPCNLRFPAQIGAIGHSDVVAPDNSILGFFNTPGDCVALGRWLNELPEVEALIVSIDMLAYGGLVASRRPRVPTGEALQHLEALREFRRKRPDTPVYTFNVLMRLAITMDSDAAVANYYNISRYARLVDEAERFKSDYLREELVKVKAEIPPAVLEEYHAARARNHGINRTMIEWLAEGIFDYLMITQEDATEYGLHRQEQDALLQRVEELNVGDRMTLHPGADEAAMTLLARYWNTEVSFRAHWSSLEDAARIAIFEDRPYNQGLAQHIEALRGVMVQDDSAEFELFVNAPVGGSQKDESEADGAARRVRLVPFLRELASAVETGKQVALCDVGFPNGADNVLMTELEERKLLGRLTVFGGWNTAGNTTGTVLAQCAALKRDGQGAEQLSRNFLFERYLDDWFYQARVRARVEKSAREQNISPFNMNGNYAEVEAQTRRELKGMAQLLAKRHFNATLADCEVTLPWHRTFEVDVRAELA